MVYEVYINTLFSFAQISNQRKKKKKRWEKKSSMLESF